MRASWSYHTTRNTCPEKSLDAHGAFVFSASSVYFLGGGLPREALMPPPVPMLHFASPQTLWPEAISRSSTGNVPCVPVLNNQNSKPQRKYPLYRWKYPVEKKKKNFSPTVVVGEVHERQVRVVVAEGGQEAQPRGLQEPHHLRRETRKRIGVQYRMRLGYIKGPILPRTTLCIHLQRYTSNTRGACPLVVSSSLSSEGPRTRAISRIHTLLTATVSESTVRRQGSPGAVGAVIAS